MREWNLDRVKPTHPHAWLWEPLEAEASCLVCAMFGTKAIYLDGKLVLCFAAKSEPWRGVLVCTDRPRHALLIADLPLLSPHPILPKWLYLSEAEDGFERAAVRLVTLVRARDPRIGVDPGATKRKRGKQ